jgi:hypothetical protein
MFKSGVYDIRSMEDVRQFANEFQRLGKQLSQRTYLENSIEPETPVNGGVLWVQSGELRYKGSNGTITIIAMA